MPNSLYNNRYWLYVIKCEGNKWYVGITSRTPQERYYDHVKNIRPAAWTRKYRPVKLYDFEDLGNVSEQDAKRKENNTTRAYMQKYGLNNVRGGKYCDMIDYVASGNDFYRKDVWSVARAGRISITILILIIALLCILLLAKP